MGKGWFDRYPVAAQTFAAAEGALGYDIAEVCFNGPAERLNRTDVAQVAIYTTSVACYQALVEMGHITDIDAAAGLSLGEFTALHLAGAFDFLEGLKLVQVRGRAMQDAAEASPSSMVAIIGADEAQINELCDEARGDGVLVPANFNCPGQVVISGSKDACERSLQVADKMKLRATPLSVAGAFHSPFMKPAADRLAAALEEVDWRPLRATVISNVTAEAHDGDSPESIKQRLVEQLTSPVRWTQSMQRMTKEFQQHRYVELAPGKVLAGLMRRIDRNVAVENFAEPKTS